MKKNKITLFVSTLSALTCVLMCNLSASAASEKIELKLNDATTETAKVVDVYYSGTWDDVAQFNIRLDVTSNALKMTKSNFSTDFEGANGVYKASNNSYKISAAQDPAVETSSGSLLLGTVTIPVAAGTGEFTIKAYELQVANGNQTYMVYFDGYTDADYEETYEGEVYTVTEPATLTIPGAKPAGPTPVPTKDLGTFKTYADAAVSAYTASIESADVDKTINWVFSNAEGKTFAKAATIGNNTDVTGDATIVLGLKVMGGIPSDVASVVLTVE